MLQKGFSRGNTYQDQKDVGTSSSNKSVVTKKSDQEVATEATPEESSLVPLTKANSEDVVDTLKKPNEVDSSPSLNEDSGKEVLNPNEANDQETKQVQNSQATQSSIPEETQFTVLKERQSEKALKESANEPLEPFVPETFSSPQTIPEIEVKSIEDFFSKHQVKREQDVSQVLSQEEPRKMLSDLLRSSPISEVVKDDLSVFAVTELMRRGDPDLVRSVHNKCQESFPELASEIKGSQVNKSNK